MQQCNGFIHIHTCTHATYVHMHMHTYMYMHTYTLMFWIFVYMECMNCLFMFLFFSPIGSISLWHFSYNLSFYFSLPAFLDRVSYSTEWPWTPDLPASVPRVLRLHVCVSLFYFSLSWPMLDQWFRDGKEARSLTQQSSYHGRQEAERELCAHRLSAFLWTSLGAPAYEVMLHTLEWVFTP